MDKNGSSNLSVKVILPIEKAMSIKRLMVIFRVIVFAFIAAGLWLVIPASRQPAYAGATVCAGIGDSSKCDVSISSTSIEIGMKASSSDRSTNLPQATTLCVQPGNPACFSTISAALASAHTGDTIRVAAGTFIEYVTITKTVTLEGGWNSAFTARDPHLYQTVIRPPDASLSVVHIQGQYGNPAVVAPIFDGFTITGGGGGDHGGGLRVTNSNAIVRDNVITGNVGYLLGGGIWVQNGAPVIQNNQVENNHINQSIGGWGGGIELEGTQATLIGNLIANNTISDSVAYGGGVAVEGGGPVKMTNNTITNNFAATMTSATPQYDTGYGGGVYIENAPADLKGNFIQSNRASGISALGFGGAYGYGGGIAILNSPAFTLTANTIISNTAGYKYYLYLSGGGLEIKSSNGSLTGNVIAGNHANGNVLFGNGGGLAVYTSTLNIQGGQILNNVTSINCEGYGGGLYAQGSSITLDAVLVKGNCAANSPFYGQGGGLALFNTPYTLTDAIITHNRSYNNDTSVGGIYAGTNSPGWLFNNTLANNYGQGIRTASPITLTNNIIMGQTTGISLTGSVPANVTYNDFYANTTHQKGFSLDASNIVINPQLDANFKLTSLSALIDAGTRNNAPNHDFEGEPRPMRGTSGFFRFDIGADEFTGEAQTIHDLAMEPADFTLIGPGNPQDNPNSDGSNDWIGNAVMGGDINGDQRDDLVVGAQNLSSSFSGGTNDDGRVFSLYNNGTPRLGIVDLYTSTADLEVRSWLNQQHIGQSFAASDLNGDNFKDLIIGASGAAGFNVKGSVFVFAGGPGLSGTRTLSPTMQATYRFLADQNTSTFGGANALAAGQLDGSGPADLVVGEENATPNGRSQAGEVYVFLGSSSLPALWDLHTQPASLTIYGPSTNANLGKVAIADVNNDGKLDLIARSASTVYVFYGPLGSGVIDLVSQSANLSVGGLSAGPLAAGDVNGDGKADILVGDGNQVKVLSGEGLGLMATYSGVTATSLHSLDWNSDGKADVAIGEDLQNRAFVVLGKAPLACNGNIVDCADWVITGEQPGDHLGFSVGGGDLDADGSPDLIVGSRSHVLSTRTDPHFNDAGTVYVFYSSKHFLSQIQGLSSVTIIGPLTGSINTQYTFSAAVDPITATLPLTYTWSPQPASGQWTNIASYIWPSNGQKNFSVTVANPKNSVSSSHNITIGSATVQERNIYLPTISK
jgi:hypothetical protein